MLVDATLYFNEADMLRARLEYLKDVVDLFIVVECSRDHSNRPYASNFDKCLLDEYPIRFVRLTDLPDGESNWPRVWWHRNGILGGLDGFDIDGREFEVPDQSLVLISDLDEFPRRELLTDIKAAYHLLVEDIGSKEEYDRLCQAHPTLPVVYQLFHSPEKEPHVAWLMNQMFYYHVGAQKPFPWIGSRLATAAHVRHVSPEVVRRWPAPVAQIVNAGWHFSYFGGADAVKRKMEAIAESSWAGRGEFTEAGNIKNAIRTGKDLYGRDGEDCILVPPPADLPKEILKYFPYETPTTDTTLDHGMRLPEVVSPKLRDRLNRLPSVNGYRDMKDYLPILADLAEKYGQVTEFGTFNGVSTTGLLVGLLRRREGGYQGFDLACQPDVYELSAIADEGKIHYLWTPGDIRRLSAGDLQYEQGLFLLDSDHTKAQVAFELNLVHEKAECIALHDTVLFGEVGNDGGPGILPAVREFLAKHPEWVVTQDIKTGVGFMVLEKRTEPTNKEYVEAFASAPKPPLQSAHWGGRGTEEASEAIVPDLTDTPPCRDIPAADSAILDILIVAHNPGEDLPRLLDSIEKNTVLPYHLFLWDNRSSDGTRDFIKNWPHIHQWTDAQENMGFILPNVRMYERGDAPFVCLLNTDTEVFPGWDTSLHSHWHLLDAPGVVGYRGSLLDENGLGVAGIVGPEADYIEGWCFFTSRAVVSEALGGVLFDSRNLLFAYAEDSETCLRLKEAGRQLYAIPKPLVVHKGGQTTQKVIKQSEAYLEFGVAGGSEFLSRKRLNAGFAQNHAYLRTRHAEYLKSGRFLARHPEVMAQLWGAK